eukprot:4362945-Prymnesium_polylepis.1
MTDVRRGRDTVRGVLVRFVCACAKGGSPGSEMRPLLSQSTLSERRREVLTGAKSVGSAQASRHLR